MMEEDEGAECIEQGLSTCGKFAAPRVRQVFDNPHESLIEEGAGRDECVLHSQCRVQKSANDRLKQKHNVRATKNEGRSIKWKEEG